MQGLGLQERTQALRETRLARHAAREARAAVAADTEVAPVLFWKDTQKNGYLSNWARSPLCVDGRTFNCVEQYIMWSKAVLMGDGTREAAIMATADPQRQKRLGKCVHPWDEALWARRREAVLCAAVAAKFGQNEELRARLLRTHPRRLAEASPSDNVYGIGMAPDDPRAQDPAVWKGQNLLGRALEQVRADLLAQAEPAARPGSPAGS
uniref:NADAR domain-containing protein n=1 Tax=Zooxanthella nutricula TaxID=1333877 RepID=A0A7S2KLB6_9DINO